MTLEQFYNEVADLPESHENRDLEEYLMAVYKNVMKFRHSEATLELTLKIFKDSFSTEPVEFEPKWLDIRKPPDGNRMSRKFTNLEISAMFDKSNIAQHQGADFTIQVLEFQVAELHKMRDKQLKNAMRYFGVSSETNNQWFNFDPFTNLECGVRCMIDNNYQIENVDWGIIGEILENGRIYE